MEEGGSLGRLRIDDLLAQLDNAQLERLLEHECANGDFEAFFEALAPVQRARAEEEQLIHSCATLARATVERAASANAAVASAVEAKARIADVEAQLEEMHAAHQRAWNELASRDAVERGLNVAIATGRERTAAIRTQIERGEASAEDDRVVQAYVSAAYERHSHELLLMAVNRQRQQPQCS